MKTPSRILTGIAAAAVLAAGMALPANAAVPTDTTATTTATATVPAGTLSITAPATFSMPNVAPGSYAESRIQGLQVRDQRAGTAGWTATVTVGDLVGTKNPANRISADNVTYIPQGAGGMGEVTLNRPQTASKFSTNPAPQVIQSTSSVRGNNTITWEAILTVSAPSKAMADTYAVEVVHSVF